MSNKLSNWARRGIEALLVATTLVGSNCVYGTRSKTSFPIEVKMDEKGEIYYNRFEKVGNDLMYITPYGWWVDKNYKEGKITFDEFRVDQNTRVIRDEFHEKIFEKMEKEAQELLDKALNK